MSNNKFWDFYKLLKTINKSRNKEIRIALAKKNKAEGIDIREYYGEDGQMLPGKRGLLIPKEEWSSFASSVNEIGDIFD